MDRLILHHREQAMYQPMMPYDSFRLHKHLGFQLNMQHMPKYFQCLQGQAQKQLNEEDTKTIIKSRHICESKLERASDVHELTIRQSTRAVRT